MEVPVVEVSATELTPTYCYIELSAGRQEIMVEVDGFKFPLKIVVDIENDIMVVVTCYPVKRGIKK